MAMLMVVVRKVVVLTLLRRLELLHWPLTRLLQLATWCYLMWGIGSLRRMIGLALPYAGRGG
jgi:hypothetical protein